MQRRVQRVTISREAMALFRQQREAVSKGCQNTFPGDVAQQSAKELKHLWAKMRASADIPDVRMHDLRHAL